MTVDCAPRARLPNETIDDVCRRSIADRCVIQVTDTFWIGHGLKFRTETEAQLWVDSQAETEARNEERRHDLRTPKAGWRIPGHGIILTTRRIDGELVADTVRMAGDNVIFDNDVSIGSNAQQMWDQTAMPRQLARWIAKQRGIIDTHQRGVHDAVCALVGDTLQRHPLPMARRVDRPEKAVGRITLATLIGVGARIWTDNDVARRINEYEGRRAATVHDGVSVVHDDADQGGTVIAVTDASDGRLFTVLRENVLPVNGGQRGLAVRHVHEDDVHRCDGCQWDPTLKAADGSLRRLWRRCHVVTGGDRTHAARGPIQPGEAVLLNAARVIGAHVA